MELDLTQLFGILRKKFYIIMASTLGMGLLAFLITTYLMTPLYEASGTLYVNNKTGSQDYAITSSDLSTSQKLVDTYIVVLQSREVLKQVADEVNLEYTAEDIKKMFRAASVNGTEVFRITITNANAEHAQLIANAFLEIGPTELLRVVRAGSVAVIDMAELPLTPSSPNRAQNTIIGAMLGLILSCSLVLLGGILDTRIKQTEDLQKMISLPVLGVIPYIKPQQEVRRTAK